MRHIPLKTIDAEINGEITRISYKLQIEEIIKHPEQRVGLDEVRRGIRILDAIENATDALELEDADFEYLKKRVEGMSWPIIERWIDEFVGDVTGEKHD